VRAARIAMIASVRRAPRFTPQDAVRIAADLYGLDASASPLPSERDQNFALVDGSGQRFILKIANADERVEMLDLQNQAVARLARKCPDLQFPQLVRAVSGAAVTPVAPSDGREHFVRLFTWVEGTPLADVPSRSPALRRSLGRALAGIDA